VGVSATPYYDAKLAGLADLFPGGCRVVAAGDPDFPARLATAVDEAWEAAEALAPALRAAAEQQVAAARAAYARFEGPVARRAGLNGAVSAPRG
ncbi:MAG TPA: hypothetical protein VGO83_04245, partial [Thermoleophilaceae bacterium]|nr:hypothetical protein [Thermoleophilaceae bacterium]